MPGPPPGDLSDPGMEPTSPVSPALQEGFLPLYHLGSHGAQGDRPKSSSYAWSWGRPRAAAMPFWEGKRALRPQGQWLMPLLPEWACDGGRLESKGKGYAGRGCSLTSPSLLWHTGPAGGTGLAGAAAIRSSPSIHHNRLCGQGASWSGGSWEIHSLHRATALPLDLLPPHTAVTASGWI